MMQFTQYQKQMHFHPAAKVDGDSEFDNMNSAKDDILGQGGPLVAGATAVPMAVFGGPRFLATGVQAPAF